MLPGEHTRLFIRPSLSLGYADDTLRYAQHGLPPPQHTVVRVLPTLPVSRTCCVVARCFWLWHPPLLFVVSFSCSAGARKATNAGTSDSRYEIAKHATISRRERVGVAASHKTCTHTYCMLSITIPSLQQGPQLRGSSLAGPAKVSSFHVGRNKKQSLETRQYDTEALR